MSDLCPYLTPSAKFGYNRFIGARALKPQSYVDFSFFSFPYFFDQPTAQTTEPILMVDSSNDVFSRKEVPFRGHVTMSPKLYAWLPKNPLFGPFVDKTRFAPRSPLKLVYYQNRSIDFLQQTLKRRHSTPAKQSVECKSPNSHREPTGPPKPKIVGVL